MTKKTRDIFVVSNNHVQIVESIVSLHLPVTLCLNYCVHSVPGTLCFLIIVIKGRFFCYNKCSVPLLYKSHSSLERQVTCSVRITPSMAQDTL